MRHLAGGAGVVSTVGDLARFDIALDAGTLVKDPARLFTPPRRADGTPSAAVASRSTRCRKSSVFTHWCSARAVPANSTTNNTTATANHFNARFMPPLSRGSPAGCLAGSSGGTGPAGAG